MKTVPSAPVPEVPSDWGTIILGEVCRVANGCPFESRYFNEDTSLPLVRARDVNAGISKTFYSGPYDEKYLIANGDLLVGMDGDFHVRKWTAGKALLNQRVCRLIADTKQLNDGRLKGEAKGGHRLFPGPPIIGVKKTSPPGKPGGLATASSPSLTGHFGHSGSGASSPQALSASLSPVTSPPSLHTAPGGVYSTG